MTVTRDDFDDFFAGLHDGHPPFAWQRRLLTTVLDGRQWPQAVVAPTGAGKTAAIDVHVFALACAAAVGAPLPPRRLAMVVDRRVLVDDQYRYARWLADRLAEPGDDAILKRVSTLLWQVHGTAPAGHSPLLVARLRGGEPPSRRWIDHPTAPAMLCATPDMWGSRLLFRGYGSSDHAWPREAGLLAFDTVAVVDEAHLAQQLLHTARRVAELAHVAEHPWDGPPPLQVVESTATPTGHGATQVGVEHGDLDASPVLDTRMRRPKPVTLVARKDWSTTRPRHTVADELARQAAILLDQADDQTATVGCFVNTVARAVAVTAALRNPRVVGRDLTVVMLCGQVRPIDVALLEHRYPGLLTPRGNAEVDVLVSTQTLEVGVDLDLSGAVTELAAASAVVQRAGRVNRRGLRRSGPIVVIVPAGPIRGDARSGPYSSPELTEAAEWLDGRAADHHGLAPWTLLSHPPPVAARRRPLLQRPELAQAWHWARTSDDLAAEPELDLWLADDLGSDASVGIVVRDRLPVDPADATELVRYLPPRRHETFAVPIGTARTALAAARREARETRPVDELSAVLVRGDTIEPLAWTDDDIPRVRPGDLLVLDAATPLFTASRIGGHRASPVVVPDEETGRHLAEDVLEAEALIGVTVPIGRIVHRIELTEPRDETPDGSNHAELRRKALVAALEPPAPDDAPLDERVAVSTWLDTYAITAMAKAAADLLRSATHRVDVVVQRDDADVAVRVLVIDRRRAVADEYARQEWTPSSDPVTLDAHQRDVAQRVGALADRVGIDDLADALRDAALHHDDGKADPRFQVRLGARATTVLAKSHGQPTAAVLRRRVDRSGLPPGWRHEQRSVVDAWPAIRPGVDRELVARLIGTTHGHGRSGFPHTATDLLTDLSTPDMRATAAALFDEGGWDELIERTQQRYGVWGCAYLEAVLRAADGQISAEGR